MSDLHDLDVLDWSERQVALLRRRGSGSDARQRAGRLSAGVALAWQVKAMEL